MNEVVRRIVWAVTLLGSIWLGLYTRTELIRVYETHPSRAVERHKRWFPDAEPNEILSKELEGRSVRLEGAEWAAYHDRVSAFFAGGHPDPELKRRASTGHSQGNIYYLPDEGPVKGIAARLSDSSPFAYLEFPKPGGNAYLGAVLTDLGDGMHEVPAWLAHPYRRAAAWLLLAGIAVYALIPWRRADDTRAMYSRLRGAILPDVVGSLLGGVFFALPLLVTTGNSMMGDIIMDHGYLGVTLLALAMSVFGLVIWAVAAWYAAYEITLLPDSLRITTLRGSRQVPFGSIAAVKLSTYTPPGWLQAIGWVVAIANPRQGGPVLLGTTQGDTRMAIELHSGETVRFTLVGLLGAPRVLAALVDAGVQVDPELVAFVLDEDDNPDETRRSESLTKARQPAAPARPTIVFQSVALAVIAIAAVALVRSHERRERDWVAMPEPVPVVAPPVKQVLEQDRILREMTTVKAEMDRAVELVKSADAKVRAQGTKDFSAAKERFDALHEEFEKLPAKFAKSATRDEDSNTTE
jgi:hypothetical protein